MTEKTRRKRRPGKAIITPLEATRAIYLDYECSKDRPPTLLGYRVEGELRAGIVERSFDTCAERRGARHATTADHTPLVAELVKRAVEEDRVIISWSEHDFRQMIAALENDPGAPRGLKEQYRNAIHTAKKWRRRFRKRARVESNDLDTYRRLVRIHVPTRFGQDIAGKALRLLRHQLHQGRVWSDLTPGARQAWRNLVRHNAFDLDAMAGIITFAAERLARGLSHTRHGNLTSRHGEIDMSHGRPPILPRRARKHGRRPGSPDPGTHPARHPASAVIQRSRRDLRHRAPRPAPRLETPAG